MRSTTSLFNLPRRLHHSQLCHLQNNKIFKVPHHNKSCAPKETTTFTLEIYTIIINNFVCKNQMTLYACVHLLLSMDDSLFLQKLRWTFCQLYMPCPTAFFSRDQVASNWSIRTPWVRFFWFFQNRTYRCWAMAFGSSRKWLFWGGLNLGTRQWKFFGS